MLPVGFSLSSFSRMRAPFPGTTWRKANKEVLPMQSRMSRGNSFMMAVTFLTWLNSSMTGWMAGNGTGTRESLNWVPQVRAVLWR
jgi:hypothetical protein